MTDISFNLNNSDLRIATSAARDGKDAGSQPWEYQVDNISAAGGLDSGTSSLHEGDTEERQEFRGRVLLLLVYQSIGVVYGDIGTSPLYVYSSTFTSNPSHDDLLGVLSLIIWTLTLMVSVKYVLIVLSADDRGGGGVFALYSLLCRYADITDGDRRSARMVSMRYPSTKLPSANMKFRRVLEAHPLAHAVLKGVAVVGVCLMIADGVLTPAQSVLAAIQGLKIVRPDMSSSAIIGISCAVLVVLFLVQRFGTTKVAVCFAPVVMLWLILNFAFGIYNLAVHDHTVLKAFSPYFAGQYFVRNKTEGWRSLGGVLLAFTGVEAMYANLGAFNQRAIRISWLCFAYPCLLIAYIGQAAYISDDPGAYSNPFFKSLPPRLFWPGFIISILAAIVASQALITGTFQLISQVMNLSYFPKVKLLHTSATFHGQVYIPLANWLLMIGTVAVTAVYHDTARLGRAYGTCVVLVTFITTCMVSVVAIIIWRIHPVIVLVGFLIFASLDGLYLSSALTKVPDGAWFTLMLTAILSIVLFVWRYGKEQQWRAEMLDRISLGQLVVVDEGKLCLSPVGLSPKESGGELTEIKGVGIFFDKDGDMSPAIYTQFLRKFKARHELTIFFHLHPLPKPQVDPEEQYKIIATFMPNCFQVHVRHGFNEHVVTQNLGQLIGARLRDFITGHGGMPNNSPDHRDETTRQRLEAIAKAYEAGVVYIIGKEQLKPKSETSLVRRLALGAFIWLRQLSRSKVAEMDFRLNDVFEVGIFREV